MMRKTKFGLNIDEVIIVPKKENQENQENQENLNCLDNQIKCSLCEIYNHENLIHYSNCKLKGVKFDRIGRYKDCDNQICIECIKRCEEIKKGNKVVFKYYIFRTKWCKLFNYGPICTRNTEKSFTNASNFTKVSH